MPATVMRLMRWLIIPVFLSEMVASFAGKAISPAPQEPNTLPLVVVMTAEQETLCRT